MIGNGVDENCDTRVEPFPPLTGSVSSAWTKVGRRTRNLTLIARDFPRGRASRCAAAARLPAAGRWCAACAARRGRSTSTSRSGGARSRQVRLELRFTRPNRVGRLLRYRLRSPGTPDVEFLCVPPGGAAGALLSRPTRGRASCR